MAVSALDESVSDVAVRLSVVPPLPAVRVACTSTDVLPPAFAVARAFGSVISQSLLDDVAESR